jgi:hypothetical protein
LSSLLPFKVKSNRLLVIGHFSHFVRQNDFELHLYYRMHDRARQRLTEIRKDADLARPFSSSDSNPDSAKGAGHKARSLPGAPWWVKALGIAVAVLVLLVVILHLTGHGFGGHMSMPAER